jgi:heat-inducible transcriptional repressor
VRGRRVADLGLDEESVELCRGEWVGAVGFDRVLGCYDHERIGQRMTGAVDGDLLLFHRFEQRGLSFRRGSIDLVAEDEVGKDRSGLKQEGSTAIGCWHRRAGHVTGYQVGGELNSAEVEFSDLGERSGNEGLCLPWNVLDEDVSSSEQSDHHQLQNVAFTYDSAFNFVECCPYGLHLLHRGTLAGAPSADEEATRIAGDSRPVMDGRNMDERKATVLKAVVETFIDTAQPVGSRAVADRTRLDVSSATIRSEMASLETEGYLHQPHTSAGRIPTEKGYRYFVDALGPGRLSDPELVQVRAFFRHARGEIEQRLHDTTRLMSTLTDYAAVVVGPAHDPAVIRSIQLVDLDGSRVLLVVVFSSGTVERHALDLADVPGALSLSLAQSRLSDALIGRSADANNARASIGVTGDPPADAVIDEALRLFAGDQQSADLYIGGAANMATQFDAVGTVQSVLEVLEEQLLVVGLLAGLVDRGLHVAIGSETGVEPLSECSVVVAPYEVDGKRAGSIGLLGPTRMDYPKALAAVHLVSSRLGASLAETAED